MNEAQLKAAEMLVAPGLELTEEQKRGLQQIISTKPPRALRPHERLDADWIMLMLAFFRACGVRHFLLDDPIRVAAVVGYRWQVGGNGDPDGLGVRRHVGHLLGGHCLRIGSEMVGGKRYYNVPGEEV